MVLNKLSIFVCLDFGKFPLALQSGTLFILLFSGKTQGFIEMN